MARRFAKVSEEIEEAFFYPSDLIKTKTTIPLRVGEERWIYTSTLRVSVYIHHYSPPLRGIVVYYFTFEGNFQLNALSFFFFFFCPICLPSTVFYSFVCNSVPAFKFR